jgi:hypothetical protein
VCRLLPALLLLSTSALLAQSGDYSFQHAQALLNQYCLSCHQGKSPAGNFVLKPLASETSLREDSDQWHKAAARLMNGEMPPKGAPAPALDDRERFARWVDQALRAEICAAGPVPGPAPIRRLNRDEFAATLRDLLDMQMDVANSLPEDGAGGEGFDNAAETLFVSPLHSEKYMGVAKFAIDFAAKEYKSRAKVLIAKPESGVSPEQAARTILENFLPLAFRRPIADAEVAPYMALFQAARKQGQPFEPAIFFALRGVLVSPNFLFRMVPPNNTSEPRPLDDYSLASRLSYFLWGSMPDELLFDVAAAGKLQDLTVLRDLIPRMLRNDRSLVFAQRFIEQWLRTRELTGEKAPDPTLFPAFAADEDLRSDIRLQPVLFFRELLVQNLSLLNLIDSKGTIGTRHLERHFGLKLPLRSNARTQPQWVDLPEGSNRGGLLGMPAILSVTSHPYRTSPVLRGTWILDSLLGTPPPPPPPDVPPLEENKDGTMPKTVRERLARHRDNPACASCHSRIDPLGFALENYDVLGRWRDTEGDQAVDNTAELSDGTKFHGPDQLKAILLERKDLFLRNLTSKMLGYALGRGLTAQDSCTVDSIVAELRQNDYRAQKLIEAIVLSVPFRNQAPAARGGNQRGRKGP